MGWYCWAIYEKIVVKLYTKSVEDKNDNSCIIENNLLSVSFLFSFSIDDDVLIGGGGGRWGPFSHTPTRFN